MLLLHLNVTKNLSVCWHVLIRFVDNYSVLALLFTATLFVAYMYGCLSYKIGVQTMLRQSYQLFLVALFATSPADVVVFYFWWPAVLGCADLDSAPEGATISRHGNTTVIRCVTSSVTWSLVCDGQKWSGPSQHCTTSGLSLQPVNLYDMAVSPPRLWARVDMFRVVIIIVHNINYNIILRFMTLRGQ